MNSVQVYDGDGLNDVEYKLSESAVEAEYQLTMFVIDIRQLVDGSRYVVSLEKDVVEAALVNVKPLIEWLKGNEPYEPCGSMAMMQLGYLAVHCMTKKMPELTHRLSQIVAHIARIHAHRK